MSLFRMRAILVGSNYKRKKQDTKYKSCPICLAKRSCLSGHLLRVHSISKKSPEVKSLPVAKQDAAKLVAEGIYKEVDKVIAKFEEEYFDHLDGATKAVKPETAEKTKKRKLQMVRKICYFIGMWHQAYHNTH